MEIFKSNTSGLNGYQGVKEDNMPINRDESGEPIEITYTVTYSRNMTTASGDASYLGCPFPPKGVFIFTSVNSCQSYGMVSSLSSIGTNELYNAVYSNAGTTTWASSTGVIAAYYLTPTAKQLGAMKAFESNGITLTWTKTGSPTGTLGIMITFLR